MGFFPLLAKPPCCSSPTPLSIAPTDSPLLVLERMQHCKNETASETAQGRKPASRAIIPLYSSIWAAARLWRAALVRAFWGLGRAALGGGGSVDARCAVTAAMGSAWKRGSAKAAAKRLLSCAL